MSSAVNPGVWKLLVPLVLVIALLIFGLSSLLGGQDDKSAGPKATPSAPPALSDAESVVAGELGEIDAALDEAPEGDFADDQLNDQALGL